MLSDYTEKLFSYGTLRYESVQLSTFGRKLKGNIDVLTGYDLKMIPIKDPDVIFKSGELSHPIIYYTGNKDNQIEGVVFDISVAELKQADLYEVDDYRRIKVQLLSGNMAWVYVK